MTNDYNCRTSAAIQTDAQSYCWNFTQLTWSDVIRMLQTAQRDPICSDFSSDAQDGNTPEDQKRPTHNLK